MAIPPNAQRWPNPMDPGQRTPFAIDWSDVLDTESAETIDEPTWQIIVGAEAAALGFQVEDGGGREPVLTNFGTVMTLWFSVAPGNQNDLVWNAGVDVPIRMIFETTSTPSKRWERTFVVRVTNL